jgi:hypothetical protein
MACSICLEANMAKPKQPKDSRSELIGVRFTSTEKQVLEERSPHLPLSTFIRDAVLRRSIPAAVPAMNWQAYQTLLDMSEMLRQINQSLRAIAQQHLVSEDEKVQSQLSLLQDLRNELKQLGQVLLATSDEPADEEIHEGEYNL